MEEEHKEEGGAPAQVAQEERKGPEEVKGDEQGEKGANTDAGVEGKREAEETKMEVDSTDAQGEARQEEGVQKAVEEAEAGQGETEIKEEGKPGEVKEEEPATTETVAEEAPKEAAAKAEDAKVEEHPIEVPKREALELEDKVNQEAQVLLAPLPEGAIAEAMMEREKKEEEEEEDADKENEGGSDKENMEEEEGAAAAAAVATTAAPEVVAEPPIPVELTESSTQTRRVPNRSKAVSAYPEVANASTQTDGPVYPPIVPMPCPMWMPVPFGMYTTPAPSPVPVPLPVPVPVFVPTTRNSHRGISKQIRKIVSKVPASLLEAELLKLSAQLTGEKVAGIDYFDSDDSEQEDEYYEEAANGGGGGAEGQQQQRPQAPPMDLEKDVRGDRVLPKALPAVTPDPAISPGPGSIRPGGEAGMHRPRGGGAGRGGTRGGQKRRYSTQSRDNRAAKQAKQESPASQAVLNMVNVQPKERPDAKHHLKFTYGVNAWRHWVVQKNAELEKLRAQGKYMKTFDTDILKLRADELIYTLCMFVKEVKKPNGEEYTPDSILYLTLGIQEYLFENGRIDNIFTDAYYEPFTSALHEIVRDFKLPVNELGYFVTRIEEEHLWEAKQLGAHSPQVLLNTVIYFNTKYFLLKTVEQHKKLSFSHIMKHWKRTLPNPASRENQASVPGLEKKTILLRYYPPAANKPGKHNERKCYEQHENPDSPLRCPVKLYEFYLSKCPESTKSRNDLFYLQPERSCVPESPVWYSSNPLNNHQLDKMLQRLLMVREVQEHMLAEASENIH